MIRSNFTLYFRTNGKDNKFVIYLESMFFVNSDEGPELDCDICLLLF